MKHAPRRCLALAAALALASTLGACDAQARPPSETVTLSVSTLHNPFFREMRTGAQYAADAAGVRLHVVAADNNPARQARQLTRAVKQGSEAVLVNPVDAGAAASAVKPALRADIPVVAVDREVQAANVDSTITSDNVEGGRQAADAVASSVDGPAQVIHLRGVPNTSASRDRGRGFEEALGQYGDMQVVARPSAGFDRGRAKRLTTRLVKAHPHVQAIFAENDEMALGAVDALGRRAGTQVHVVGYDGTPEALRAIEQGRMDATVAQLPEQLGETAVEQAVTAIDGGAVAPTVPVGVELVTSGNVNEYL